jgi:hypothetical protein
MLRDDIEEGQRRKSEVSTISSIFTSKFLCLEIMWRVNYRSRVRKPRFVIGFI